VQKSILGHIDCPACGAPKGMRITHDKNEEPFGFCEAECGQQLRIGGNPRRVRLFVARHAWAAKPVPVTEARPEPEKPVTVTGKKQPAKVPEPVAVTVPPAKRSAFDDAMSMFGVGGKP
jgi:hypothetical protein